MGPDRVLGKFEIIHKRVHIKRNHQIPPISELILEDNQRIQVIPEIITSDL